MEKDADVQTWMSPVKRHKSACFPAPARRHQCWSPVNTVSSSGQEGRGSNWSCLIPIPEHLCGRAYKDQRSGQNCHICGPCPYPQDWMSGILSSTDPLRWWLYQWKERRLFTPPESKDTVIALVKRPKEDKNFQCSENTKGCGSWTELEA